MIGLIFATRIEAQPFLEWSQARDITATPMRVYRVPSNPRLLVTIGGMGKVSAAVACHCQIKEFKVEEIVNAGVCGALQNSADYAPGNLFCIASAWEGDHTLPDVPPQPLMSDGKLDWDLPAARLVTYDRPVFDFELRKTLSSSGDLVDMEGAAIARVAAMYGVPWSMIKGITDAAGPTDHNALKRNLKSVSEKVCRILWDQLRSIR
jgi:adenosylhomocysteine nucleosidase